MAECDGREEPAPWTGKATFSGPYGRAIGIEVSDSATPVDGVPVEEGPPLDVLGSVGGVGDQSPGGGWWRRRLDR